MVYSCSKCHKAITEPMVSKCDNRYWHSSCLTCQMCGHTPSMVGEQSMYMFRGSLICKNDYMRINCVCKTCSRPLSQSDMVIKANGYGYMHDKCVYCGRCQHRLETGDRFMLTTDQMIVCQKCIMQQHPQGPPGSQHQHQHPHHHHHQQQQGQMVNPTQMGPLVHQGGPHIPHHPHSGPGGQMGPHHGAHHPPPPPQYPHHSQQQQLGPPQNHHGGGSGHHHPHHQGPLQQQQQQFVPHPHSHPHSHHSHQSSPNFPNMMAPNGYPPNSNNNGTMNGMYGGHHMGPASGPGGSISSSNGPNGGPANGLMTNTANTRATPPTTPNQQQGSSATNNSGSSNTTTTGSGGGGRRGRKRNTQVKEEF